MKEALDDLIDVAHTMGGMIEFEERGTYHNSLTISSKKYGKIWQRKIKDCIFLTMSTHHSFS